MKGIEKMINSGAERNLDEYRQLQMKGMAEREKQDNKSKWIRTHDYAKRGSGEIEHKTCKNCGERLAINTPKRWKYCPVCGFYCGYLT